MIERELDAGRATGRFVIRPQRSATWRQNLFLFAAIAVVAVPLATVWSVVGFWLILPICLLQLAFVLAAFWISNRALLAREVVTIEPERIVIEAGHRQPERRFELGRHWAQVLLDRNGPRNGRRRLIIRSRGEAVECGRFLNEEERERLWRELRGVIATPAPRAGDPSFEGSRHG